MSKECLFCKIVKGQINADIVYEDDKVIAFKDINPQAPIHILVTPKKHISSVLELQSEDKELIGYIFEVAVKLAKEQNIAEKGFRIVNNCNADGGQTVFHIHFHLLGGRRMTWPPG